MTQSKGRKENIECLRSVSMLMIVTLHGLEHTGLLYESTKYTATWLIVWLLEAFCYVSVNCYVLISGYFMITSEFKLKKLFSLWGKILFYSIGISAVFYIVRPETLTLKSMFKAVTPVLSNQYWFLTIYIGLYILMPILNIAIRKMSKIQHKATCIIVLLLFCVWPSIVPISSWTLDPSSGYGIIWFACLYNVAAYIRLYRIENVMNIWTCIYIYIMCGISMLGLKLILTIILNRLCFPEGLAQLWYHYNSIPVFIGSISLFLIFNQIKIQSKHQISYISSCTLAVYLIHMHQFLRGGVIWSFLDIGTMDNSLIKVLAVVIAIMTIYIGCTIIELIRKKIFEILSFSRFSDYIYNRILSCKLTKIIREHIQFNVEAK